MKFPRKFILKRKRSYVLNEIRFNDVNCSADSCGSQNIVRTVLLGINYFISQKSASRIEGYSL